MMPSLNWRLYQGAIAFYRFPAVKAIVYLSRTHYGVDLGDMESGLDSAIDLFSQEVVVNQIELLLSYSVPNWPEHTAAYPQSVDRKGQRGSDHNRPIIFPDRIPAWIRAFAVVQQGIQAQNKASPLEFRQSFN